MRPDEHKKKRSAQYKKKHGDKVDKPKNTKQTDTKKNATQNDAQKSGSFPQTVASRTVGDDKKTDSACSSATSRDSEFEPLDEWEQQKSFRRRQVVSNWERYEGTASLTEDTPTLRGADFKAIVEAGGNTFSQFRFRDEQLWEEEEEEPAGEETLKCLAIDCEDLASALLCLPLHERLCVDKAAFQEDQIALFNELATTHQAAYEQRLHEVPSKTDTGAGSMFEDIVQSTSPDSSLIDRCSDTSQSEDILDDILRASDVNSLMEKVVLDSDSRGEDETRQILEDDDNSVKDSVILSGSAQTLEHERNRASGDCKNAENAEPTQATENTTSVILTESALHNKLAETVTQTDSTERKVLDRDESQKSVTCIEDELDFLLTLDVPVSKEEKSTQPTGNSDTGQSDSLDDWLDDMLAS